VIQNTNVGVQYIVLIMLCCELCWHLNLNQFVAFASKYGFGNYVTDVESAVWQCFSDFILICVCKSVFMHFFTLSMIVFCRLFGVLNDNDDDDDDDDDDKKLVGTQVVHTSATHYLVHVNVSISSFTREN